ncbi:acetyl-CoA synthetase-like protein [Chloropicon primus]|uniref:Long-chain-fatty-acid--CoA ligase n=1 Tax=Chloropicon primus TaxID=1764295 RepID=A0A5B8MVY9_9CHLO|nr:acetyl-CoA synthetase-like protein [Chloropicon primus]UPR02895.1 acetyl-CoA synthetase-like protein [Chloropicon primus]|eukprot:QDZ23682.1 acetyl-CoA synthetase-like protein [Chloropicon primus]
MSALQMDNWITEVEPANETQGPLYRLFNCGDGLVPYEYKGCYTLSELFAKSVEEFGEEKCLGQRNGDGPYMWLTYNEVMDATKKIASALIAEGADVGTKVGILSGNCPEWMIAMQACNRIGAACVPLYDTLGENAVEYITNHAECKVAFISAKKISVLLKTKGKIPTVTTLVYWGEPSEEELKELNDFGVNVFSYDQFLEKGAADKKENAGPMPEDLCTIMYTSGTTGDPKGVMIKHKNMVAELNAIEKLFEIQKIPISKTDRFMSYLPLAHIFDRVVEETFLCAGGAVGYWRGSPLLLLEDVAALKPTIFAGVPRIFDRIYSKVSNKMQASFIKNFLFTTGVKRKWSAIEKGVSQAKAAPLFNMILFKKLKAVLGGCCRVIVSGGAPLASHVEQFLRTSMCCPVIQGYGLTETMAASFTAVPDDIRFYKTVGVPAPSVEYRLEAVPEMNYSPFTNPPRGEILIRGPSVYAGYYKDEAQTKGAIDKDGFFHTGDVGEITDFGSLKIIDRKKNIFKLSQGEYVAVEVLESAYKKNLNMEQVWVYGNSFENCLVAVIVPNEEKIMAWASEKGVAGDYAAVCKTPEANEMILGELKKTGKEAKMKGFEIVKAVHLDSTQFSVEENLLTPTFKLKRPQLLKHYQSQVDALYEAMKKK